MSGYGWLTRALLVVSLLAPAWGVQAASGYILPENAVDPARLLPEPPGEACPEAKRELETLLQCQQARTPKEIARIGEESYLAPINFQEVFGPWFNERDLPKTIALLSDANREAKRFCDISKQHFCRRRPHFLEAQLKPVFDLDEPCYAAGHATQSRAMALVLAEVAPMFRSALLSRARDIAWHRVVAGVHYPSDCTAGAVLGQAVANALLAHPEFQSELAAAKAEFAQVRQQHPQPAPFNCQ